MFSKTAARSPTHQTTKGDWKFIVDPTCRYNTVRHVKIIANRQRSRKTHGEAEMILVYHTCQHFIFFDEEHDVELPLGVISAALTLRINELQKM